MARTWYLRLMTAAMDSSLERIMVGPNTTARLLPCIRLCGACDATLSIALGDVFPCFGIWHLIRYVLSFKNYTVRQAKELNVDTMSRRRKKRISPCNTTVVCLQLSTTADRADTHD